MTPAEAKEWADNIRSSFLWPATAEITAWRCVLNDRHHTVVDFPETFDGGAMLLQFFVELEEIDDDQFNETSRLIDELVRIAGPTGTRRPQMGWNGPQGQAWRMF